MSDADLTVTTRTRNGERWLTGPDPLDAALDGARGERFADLLAAEVQRAIDDDDDDDVTAVHWESEGDEAEVDAVAARVDLPERRDILRLERDLPVPADPATPSIAVRPLRPGTADEEAWVATNNRAFAGHPDQGRETVASLHRAMAEPWFATDDLLVLDGDDDRLAGFCWVKVHDDTHGEIYVIGVDPDAGGRGLGRALVTAGLDHMVDRGLTRALLYVDADNAPARRLYDRLGFTTTRTRRVRSRALSRR